MTIKFGPVCFTHFLLQPFRAFFKFPEIGLEKGCVIQEGGRLTMQVSRQSALPAMANWDDAWNSRERELTQ